MTVTDVKIRKKFDTLPLLAIVSVTFDNSLALHDIKIIRTDTRDIVVMPARKTGDGRFKDIVHPTNKELREQIENAIMKEYLLDSRREDDDISQSGVGEASGNVLS